MPDLPALLTTDEVAGALRVSRQTVSRWVTEGRLHAVDVPGRNLRFRREEIEAIISATKAAS